MPYESLERELERRQKRRSKGDRKAKRKYSPYRRGGRKGGEGRKKLKSESMDSQYRRKVLQFIGTDFHSWQGGKQGLAIALEQAERQMDVPLSFTHVEQIGKNLYQVHFRDGSTLTFREHRTGASQPNRFQVKSAENWGGDPEGPLAKALAKARERARKVQKLKITSLDEKTAETFEAEKPSVAMFIRNCDECQEIKALQGQPKRESDSGADYWGSGAYQQEYEHLWNELVPGSGYAPTTNGELIRIIGRLAHEYMNNGNGNLLEWGEEEDCDHCYDRGYSTGEQDCHRCYGDAEFDCWNCGGSGQVEDDEGNSETCQEECGGDGQIPCDDCNGQGTIDCEYCYGSGSYWNEDVVRGISQYYDEMFNFIDNSLPYDHEVVRYNEALRDALLEGRIKSKFNDVEQKYYNNLFDSIMYHVINTTTNPPSGLEQGAEEVAKPRKRRRPKRWGKHPYRSRAESFAAHHDHLRSKDIRVLRYLAQYNPNGLERRDQSPALTQAGIAEGALNATRSAVNEPLNRLIHAGLVQMAKRQIIGGKRKQNVYYPTWKGWRYMDDLETESKDAEFTHRPVDLDGDGIIENWEIEAQESNLTGLAIIDEFATETFKARGKSPINNPTRIKEFVIEVMKDRPGWISLDELTNRVNETLPPRRKLRKGAISKALGKSRGGIPPFYITTDNRIYYYGDQDRGEFIKGVI